jgi:LPXTG-motif cell wall-anchored protein
MRFPIRTILTRGLPILGIVVGAGLYLEGAASAHDLTGGSAQATCEGHTVTVHWKFVSGNAGDHTIQTATFNRPVTGSSHTASTIAATTVEKAGATVSLTATATFEDGYVSPYTATTTIPAEVCPAPAPTTTTPTTAPPTVPTTPPAATTPPTTAPVADTTVTPTPTTAPVPVESSVPADTPTALARPVVTLPAQLPATGSGDAIPLIAIGAGIIAAGVLLVAVRRVPRSS